MATITSTGIGSGIDINSLVSQLVAAERAAPDKRISSTDSRLTTEFSALSVLKGAMSAFQGSVSTLKTDDAFDLRKVTVGDDGVLAASVTSAAAAGTFDVEVAQLATASRLGSALYASGSGAVVGTGRLTISLGSSSFDVNITADNDELAQIRDAINGASGNPGVQASLIRDTSGTGSYLVLTSTKTGASNAITVSASGADAGLTQLAADLQSFDAQRDVAAQDAIVYFSGYEIHSATNTVSGAVDGLTLNLKKENVGKTVSLVIERDDATILSRAQNFVSGFNMLAQQMGTLSSYNAESQTAGPLLGDSMLRGMDSQLRRIISSPVPGATGTYTTLASIGITTTASGTLQLDQTRFNKALAADPAAISRIFSSESGVAVRLADYMDQKLASTGELAARTKGITDQRNQLQQQKDALDARMAVIQDRYLKQFTAMDTLLSQLQSTSSYLTQQVSSLTNLNKSR